MAEQTYLVNVWLVNIYGDDIGLDYTLKDVQSFLTVKVKLRGDMKLSEVGMEVNATIKAQLKDEYSVRAFSIDDYDFECSDVEDEDFGTYQLLIDESKGFNLEAYAVYSGTMKGGGTEFFQFEDLENEEAAQVVPKNEADGVLKQMKDGLAFLTNCSQCGKILHQIKFGRCNTVSVNLKNYKQECPTCWSHAFPSPCFLNCEFRFAGQKLNSKTVTKTEWKTPAQENHIYYFFKEEDEEYSNVVEWSELRIYVKQLNNKRCKACKQILGEYDGKNETCGHKYHQSCFRNLTENGNRNKICVVPGCSSELTKFIETE